MAGRSKSSFGGIQDYREHPGLGAVDGFSNVISPRIGFLRMYLMES